MAQEVAGAERRALALNDALKAGGAAKVDTIEHLNGIRQLRRNGRELPRSGVLFQGDHFLTLFRRRIQPGHWFRFVLSSTYSAGYHQVFPFSSRTGTCVSGHLSG